MSESSESTTRKSMKVLLTDWSKIKCENFKKNEFVVLYCLILHGCSQLTAGEKGENNPTISSLRDVIKRKYFLSILLLEESLQLYTSICVKPEDISPEREQPKNIKRLLAACCFWRSTQKTPPITKKKQRQPPFKVISPKPGTSLLWNEPSHFSWFPIIVVSNSLLCAHVII